MIAEVFENGSRKRQRLSPPEGDDASEGTDSETQTTAPMKSISRIKPRSKTTPSTVEPLEETEIHNGKTVDSRSSFGTIDVAPWLIVSLAAMEIRRPTAIQKACIPEMLKGYDVIGKSRTGSGKTVAFAVPILQKWEEDPFSVHAVILTATRELALQITEQFSVVRGRRNVKVELITGGSAISPQAQKLADRPHIVIATPGRLAEHIQYSGEDTISRLRHTRILILDEADRLLDQKAGMLPDINTCLETLPPPDKRQTCVFTATLTPEVLAMKDKPRSKDRPPVAVCEIDSESDLAIPPTLLQTYLQVHLKYREEFLHVLLQTPKTMMQSSVIVFCNHKETADYLERLLRGLEHSVTSLHGTLPQSERNSNLSRFRAKASRILVATDVASRGLDIPEVGMVINYDVPRDPIDYIHRVGRTARAGRRGTAVTLVGQRDVDLIHAIEDRVNSKMVRYEEEGVNVETRVIRDSLKPVAVKKHEVRIAMEEGRDVRGNRTRGKLPKLH